MVRQAKKYRSKAKGASTVQWQDLATNERLSREYNKLSLALQQAQAVAVQKAQRMGGAPNEYMDMERAFSIVRETPELVPYLASIAKQSSTVPLSFLEKRSPTGVDSPQQNSQGMWTGSGKQLTDGVVNARLLRQWADDNEWARAAINVRRQQIGRANIAVVPFNERRGYNKTLARKIQLLLDQPNEYRQNYYELMAGAMDDLLVLDRAIILKDMTVDRKPVHLYNEDAACVKIYPNWSGNPNEPRYLYESPTSNRKVPLRNDEVICMMSNPATYRYGLSPVQVLRNTIKADLAATQSAMQMVDMKPPPHMIQLPGASQGQLEKIRERYETDIAGQKEIFWIGGQTQAVVEPLIFSARDNQWLEWQVYLARKIAIVFQISPQQLGITFDINKATASSQQEIFEDTGLIPLLLLVESYFNEELISDFAPKLPDGRFNMEALNLRILFPEVTEADRQMHAERAIKMATAGLAGLPSMTINQVLSMFGEEPVPGGNTFYVDNKTLGPVPWLSYDGDTNGYGPASTGGNQGGQDPAGGPSLEENDPETGGGKGNYKPPTPPQGAEPVAASLARIAQRSKDGNRQFGKRMVSLSHSFSE